MAMLVSVYSIAYLFIDLPFLETKGELRHSFTWQFFLYMHFIGGGIALSTGWIQFWKRFRDKRIQTHRLIGKIYVIAVLFVGGVGAGYAALYANGGFPNMFGFGMLTLLWWWTTFQAYCTIQKGDVKSHERWMIYSYSLTLAAVTLRIWFPLFQYGFSIPMEQAYAAVAWLCWVPNIIIAEIMVRKKGL